MRNQEFLDMLFSAFSGASGVAVDGEGTRCLPSTPPVTPPAPPIVILARAEGEERRKREAHLDSLLAKAAALKADLIDLGKRIETLRNKRQ
jgi:hypothetical protein